MFYLGFSFLFFGYALGFDPSKYQHQKKMWQSNGKDLYNVYWSINGTNILLALEVETHGWIGFGIAEPTSGSMGGADILQGYYKNGKAHIWDRHVTSQYPGTNTFPEPTTDNCQNWILSGGEEIGSKTILEVWRPLVTGDAQDRPISTSGNVNVIMAYGGNSEDDIHTYHSRSRRKASFIDFSGATYADPLQALMNSPNIKNFSLLNDIRIYTNRSLVDSQDGAVLIDDSTIYVDNVIDLNVFIPELSGGDVHIVGVEHVINENTAHFVHHFILTGVSYDSINHPNTWDEHQIYAWAPGVGSMVIDQCGFRASRTYGVGDNYFKLQTHYDNPNLSNEGILEQSGVRIYYTQDFKPHDCGTIEIGMGGQAEVLPTGKTKYVFECADTSIIEWPVPEVTVLYDFLHMHAVGREQWSEHYFNDTGEWVTTNRIDFWDFNFQRFMPPLHGPYTFKKGEGMRVTCIYETGSNPVKWGPGSTDEMCINYLVYYPRVPQLDKMCLYGGQPGMRTGPIALSSFTRSFGESSNDTCPPGPPSSAPTTNSAPTTAKNITSLAPPTSVAPSSAPIVSIQHILYFLCFLVALVIGDI